MVSPFGFSLASLRCGAMLPSLADFANQYSAVSFLFSFGPQAPWTPDFSRRSITESCAAASESIAACGVFAPDDASPMFATTIEQASDNQARCCRSESTARARASGRTRFCLRASATTRINTLPLHDDNQLT